MLVSEFQLVGILVRWPGKMAEHSFFLDFFVSFFVMKKRKEENGGKFIMRRYMETILKYKKNRCFV
jgi:hypothetical protein